MRWYTLSWLAATLNKPARAAEFLARAEAASPRYCFPARIEEMIVLKSAIARNPSAARAHYYLGNLYYDKRRYDEAIRSWRRSVELDSCFLYSVAEPGNRRVQCAPQSACRRPHVRKGVCRQPGGRAPALRVGPTQEARPSGLTAGSTCVGSRSIPSL